MKKVIILLIALIVLSTNTVGAQSERINVEICPRIQYRNGTNIVMNWGHLEVWYIRDNEVYEIRTILVTPTESGCFNENISTNAMTAFVHYSCDTTFTEIVDYREHQYESYTLFFPACDIFIPHMPIPIQPIVN